MSYPKLFFLASIVCFLIGNAPERAFATDVRQFDIDGVKLYMSSDEVISALKQRFGNDIHLDIVSLHQSILTENKKLITYISYNTSNFTLTIYFVEKAPPDGGHSEIVSKIYLTETGTDKDLSELADAIHKKFGQPSIIDVLGTERWCEPTAKAKLCFGVPQMAINKIGGSEFVDLSDVVSLENKLNVYYNGLSHGIKPPI